MTTGDGVSDDEFEPIGYDGFGAPIYPHQVDPEDAR